MMKRVLVTGGNGFVGRNCLPLLMEHGYDVHAVSRTGDGSVDGVAWHSIDLLDNQATELLIKRVKPTHLLHLAWYVEHGKFWQANENLDWVVASLNLLKGFAQFGGQRFVGVGSCAEYDWSQGVCDEASTPLRPHTFYGQCKNGLREIASGYCSQNSVSFAWARLFHLYGPHENPQRLIPYVIQQMQKGDRVVINSANKLRDFTYVEDVASALVALLSSGCQGAVNIGSGEPMEIGELVAKVAAVMNCTAALELYGSPHTDNDPEQLIPRLSKLNGEVKWRPKYSFDEGVRMTIDWYAQIGRSNSER